MEIRNAKIEDLEQIVSIMMQISELHYEKTPDIFKNKTQIQVEKEVIENLNHTEKNILVATDETSKIYGILIYQVKEVINHENLKDSKVLLIKELGVDETFKRQGIGKELIEKAEKIAKKLECKRIELNVWEFNENAIKFYEAIGMKPQRKMMEKEIGE